MIIVTERENPVDMVEFVETDKLLLNPLETTDWRIRRVVFDKVMTCAEALPDGLCLMIFDAFRPRTRQWELWNPVFAQISKDHPEWDKTRVYTEASRWVAPPDGFGSGHQAGAAVDLKLARTDRTELDFGGLMKGLSGVAPTEWPVAPGIRRNRDMLVTAMHATGMVNYPDEWWHFSYGDRLWAEVTGQNTAFFAPIDQGKPLRGK
ncbi:MAG: D-alanyl-D-alanine carboxypeptidase family protein [Rhodobacteraceae bacterium]|nr:D-alanyl-D-alanine carboxypeptidase family protein [Paracoccaceae bacterium]